MSAVDTLKQVQTKAADLARQYQQIAKEKERLEQAHFNSEDAGEQRKIMSQLQALVPQIEPLVKAAVQLRGQGDTALEGAQGEIDAMHSSMDDDLADIDIYATDWPGEIKDLITDIQAWIDENKSGAPQRKAAGAHSIYR